MYFVVTNHVYMTLRQKSKASGKEDFQMLHLKKRIKVNTAKNNHN